MNPPSRRPRLRLVPGGRPPPGNRIVPAPRDQPPFPVDAVVVEQDTDLLLSPPADRVEEPDEHIGRLVVPALNQRSHRPGEVVMAAGEPPRLYAVVLDLERDPTWNEEWVAEALTELMEIARPRQYGALAMPLLGNVHGRLPLNRAVALTRAALDIAAPAYPRRVWLQVEAPELALVRAALAHRI